MTARNAATILLGPQRRTPNVRETLNRIPEWSRERPTAVVTAGWEDRELEDLPFRQHIEGPVHNLEVFHRMEKVYASDRELHAAVRARHDRMRELKDLHRIRLGHALGAARDLLARGGDSKLLRDEVDDAIESVRRLDSFHADRMAAIQQGFQERVRPWERDAVARHREELRSVLAECPVLCIAGGHVGILLSRMRLLGILDLHADRPVVAWSAGAMALTERVVLFHDSPPQGPADPEIFETGLGVAPGVVALPDADQRLRLDDRARVALFARRFAPALCAALLPAARFEHTGSGVAWHGADGARHLCTDGSVREGAA